MDAYLKHKAEMLRDGLILEVNGQRLPLQTESKEIIFPPGASGLPTLKIGVLYSAKLTGDSKNREHLLSYRDGNFPGRAGWKEVIAVAGPSTSILSSSVSEADRSSQLNDYATDLLNSPPQELEARVRFAILPVPLAAVDPSPALVENIEKAKTQKQLQTTRADVAQLSSQFPKYQPSVEGRAMSAGVIDRATPPSTQSGSIQLQANRQAMPRSSFTDLIATRQLGPEIILIALSVAVGLGAFHALEPGHGKTLVAAYLVGSRGTVKHAFLLGLSVTAAHTAGVYLLGAATLYASKYVVPEQLYPWLGVISGIIIAGLGLVLLVRRYPGRDGLSSHHHHHADYCHGSDHPHHHHHHGHSHNHGQTHDPHDFKEPVSLRELVTLGISGGIVPCPAALVVLLSAVSLQKIGFGLLLIVAFSAGLAAVLIGIGLLVVCAGQLMKRFATHGRLVTHWLPLASSTVITLFGLGMVIQAVP